MCDHAKRNEALAWLRAKVLLVKHLERQSVEGANKNQPYLKKLLEEERAEMEACAERARLYMKGLKQIEYEFVIAFFFSGMSIQETGTAIDRSIRQCERLRKRFSASGGTDRRQRKRSHEEENTNERDFC